MSTTKRTFSPLYKPADDADTDLFAFFHVLERLKTQKRTGWIDHDVPNPESISDHMHRMAILAMCTSDATLDIPKCVMMSVVHDLAEAQVGDITPREGISKEEKQRLEAARPEAMHNFVHDMLHGRPAALRIEALWEEYEHGVTPEAKFVKGTYPGWMYAPQYDLVPYPIRIADLDRLEMALQAREYEERHRRARGDLQGFYDSALPFLRHPEVCHWGDILAKERESDFESRSGP